MALQSRNTIEDHALEARRFAVVCGVITPCRGAANGRCRPGFTRQDFTRQGFSRQGFRERCLGSLQPARQESQSEAGEGNRTLVFSLEGYCSTIELHPRLGTTGRWDSSIGRVVRWVAAPLAASSRSFFSLRLLFVWLALGLAAWWLSVRSLRACGDDEIRPKVRAGAGFWWVSGANAGLQRLHVSGECRIRTCEGKIHQIYSLTPLTARETPRARIDPVLELPPPENRPTAKPPDCNTARLQSRPPDRPPAKANAQLAATVWRPRERSRSELAAGVEPATC